MTEAARHGRGRPSRAPPAGDRTALNEGPATRSDVAQARPLSRGAPPLVASLGLVVVGDSEALTVLRALGDVVPHLSGLVRWCRRISFPRSWKPLRTLETRGDRVARRTVGSVSRAREILGEWNSSDGAFVAVPLVEDDRSFGAPPARLCRQSHVQRRRARIPRDARAPRRPGHRPHGGERRPGSRRASSRRPAGPARRRSSTPVRAQGGGHPRAFPRSGTSASRAPPPARLRDRPRFPSAR